MKLIFFLLLLILSCKSENNTLSERKEKSNLVLKDKVKKNLVLKKIESKIINFNIDSLSSISLKKNIPFGNKQLIEFDFPVKERLFYGGLYQQDYKPTIKEKKDSIKYAWKYTSLSNYHLLKETQNLNISNNYVSKFLKIAKDIGEIEKSFKFNIQNIKSTLFLIELPKKGNLNIFSVFFSIESGRYSKQMSPLFIVLDDLGNYISAVTSFKGNDEANSFKRFVYVDKNHLFYFKNFLSNEAVDISYQKQEKYSISTTGHFIRYYDNSDGLYENYDEKGLIKNNTKEGRWLEFKYADGNSNHRVFIESQYKGGIADGVWKFYNYPYLDEVKHSIDRERKEELLYTERYEKGVMVKREFVK